MAHTIHGIITSFTYDGELPHVVLVGNYHLIPFFRKHGPNYKESVIEPYEELTTETLKALKTSIKRQAFSKTEQISSYFAKDTLLSLPAYERRFQIDHPSSHRSFILV